MKKNLLFIILLLLVNTANSQEAVSSLNQIKGSYLLQNDQNVKYNFNALQIDETCFELFLENISREKYKLISNQSEYIEFEKVYDREIISPEIKKLKIKIIKISDTEIKVFLKEKEQTTEFNFIKTN